MIEGYFYQIRYFEEIRDDKYHVIFFDRVDSVRLGEQTFNQTKDCTVEKELNKTTCADPPQDIDVDKIFIHPRFAREQEHDINDIALIRLKQKINFTGRICNYYYI